MRLTRAEKGSFPLDQSGVLSELKTLLLHIGPDRSSRLVHFQSGRGSVAGGIPDSTWKVKPKKPCSSLGQIKLPIFMCSCCPSHLYRFNAPNYALPTKGNPSTSRNKATKEIHPVHIHRKDRPQKAVFVALRNY